MEALTADMQDDKGKFVAEARSLLPQARRRFYPFERSDHFAPTSYESHHTSHELRHIRATMRATRLARPHMHTSLSPPSRRRWTSRLTCHERRGATPVGAARPPPPPSKHMPIAPNGLPWLTRVSATQLAVRGLEFMEQRGSDLHATKDAVAELQRRLDAQAQPQQVPVHMQVMYRLCM